MEPRKAKIQEMQVNCRKKGENAERDKASGKRLNKLRKDYLRTVIRAESSSQQQIWSQVTGSRTNQEQAVEISIQATTLQAVEQIKGKQSN